MRIVLAIAVLGAFGSVARYYISGAAHSLLGARFAWGTLAVNLIGCFILGLLIQLSLSTEIFPAQWRVPLAVGFCGAFTTFSTFGYETVRFIEDGAWLLAGGNIAANMVLGILLVWLGFGAAKLIAGGA